MQKSRVITAVLRLIYIVVGRMPVGDRCKCILCGRSVRCFVPYRGGKAFVPPLQMELKTVGSDRDNFECPFCGCHDRERHAYMYLSRLGMIEGWASQRILHFAPEHQLRRLIGELAPVEYVLADLNPIDAHISCINIENIPFQDEYFDMIIANHVLEHVQNVQIALNEIYRCLKPGGMALLQTPFSKALVSTLEDPGIKTPIARLHAYGQ